MQIGRGALYSQCNKTDRVPNYQEDINAYGHQHHFGPETRETTNQPRMRHLLYRLSSSFFILFVILFYDSNKINDFSVFSLGFSFLLVKVNGRVQMP